MTSPSGSGPGGGNLAAELAIVLAAVEAASGIACVWKDADPVLATLLPPAVCHHRHPFCLAVKEDPERLRCCRRHDEERLQQGQDRSLQGLQPCPFGAWQQHLPLRCEGRLLGEIQLGPWCGSAGPLDTGLAPPEPRRIAAVTTLLERLLPAVLALREAERARRRADRDPRIAAALATIETELRPDLRAAALARRVGLSASRFVHRFKEVVGEPYRVYLGRRVMHAAAARLATSRETVTAIALDAGYANGNAFTAAFRRVFATTPSAFRRRARSGTA